MHTAPTPAINDTGAPRVNELCEHWIAARRADGLRPRGIKKYAENLHYFAHWANDPPIDQITPNLIKRYKLELMSRVSAGTTRNQLDTVRGFLAWCVDEGFLLTNVAARVKSPRVEPPNPDPLTRAQIVDLFSVLDCQNGHRGVRLRNRRAVCLMLYAGLRIAEAAGLEWRDIDLDRRMLTIRREIAKGGRPRIIPICDELAAELSLAPYREPCSPVVDQGDAPGRRGKLLGTKSLAHFFERYLRKTLSFPIHAHQLRKTFATELYLRGENLITIQRLLGHTDPKTTQRYIGASPQQELSAVQKLTLRTEVPLPEPTVPAAPIRVHAQMTIADALLPFGEYLAKRLTPKTVITYLNAVQAFIVWLPPTAATVDAVSVRLVQGYQLHLLQRGARVKDTTSMLRRFFHWCVQQGLRTDSPVPYEPGGRGRRAAAD